MYFTVLGKFQPELMWAVTKDVSLAISFDFKDYHSALFLLSPKSSMLESDVSLQQQHQMLSNLLE